MKPLKVLRPCADLECPKCGNEQLRETPPMGGWLSCPVCEWDEQRQSRASFDLHAKAAEKRRERRSNDTQAYYLASDIPTLENAADALSRAGELKHAVALWAIALRIREAVRHD